MDTGKLKQAASARRQAIDAAVARSEQLRETMPALEQRVRGTALLAALHSPSELDASVVLDEAEQLLRSLPSDAAA